MSILNFKTSANSYSCLLCSSKDNLKEFSIDRKHSKYISVIGFTICKECKRQMELELSLENMSGD